MTGLTQSLANFVAHPNFADHEDAVCAVANMGFVDTVGTMMLGCTEPVVRMVQAHVQNNPGAAQAPVPFAAVMLGVAQAAQVNSVAAHALDYDDVALSGHTSTVLVPAILAEGHRLNVSGAQALRAYVVGYEVWAELFAREADQYHLKGWHPTGVLGTVAAAAAVAYLNGMNPEQARTALAIAASMASGLTANFGTMTKPLHAGRAAACGVEAVQLTQLGLTAAADVFEHPAGFLHAISPAGQVDRTRSASTLGQQWRIMDLGLSIKRYPVCYSGHRSIDAVLAMAAQHQIAPDQVSSVKLTMGPAQISMLRNHAPQTGLEAKFSAEFAVASALVVRKVGVTELSNGFVQRPDIQQLMGKVVLTVTDTKCPMDPAFSFADRVVIELTDGRSFDSGDIRFAIGSAMNPLDEQGLRGKFMDCLRASQSGYQDAAKSEQLYAKLSKLQSLPSLISLF